MKNLLLVIIISVSVSAVGQKTQKAKGDKPKSSEEYLDYQGNDSTLFASTTYAYNGQKQVEKEIVTYFDEYGTVVYVDSIVSNYDGNGRVISVQNFRNNALFDAKIWIYDVPNQRIDYYRNAGLGGNLDSVIHVVYKNVRDFDNVEESFSSLLAFMEVSIELRDCDTIFVNSYDAATSTWNLAVQAMPKYQSGKPTSVKIDIDIVSILESVGLDSLLDDLPMNIIRTELTLTPTYSGDKVDVIRGSLMLTTDFMPIPIPNFIVLTNQYNADLLVETKIEMNIDVYGMFDQYLGGITRKYGYNWDDNVSSIVEEISIDGTNWDIDSKIYYQYNIQDIFDIEVVRVDTSGTSGHNANIEITLRNRSLSISSPPIYLTAIIEECESHTGKQTFKDTITPISPYTEIKVIIPFHIPHSPYSITAYIDSQDDYPENDTAKINCDNVSIKSINSANISVSQNIPNPVNDITVIKYNVPTDGKVQFTVYSVNGQVLFTQSAEAKVGENSLELSVSNLASGLYFYSMEFNGQRIVRKMSVQR